LPAELQHTLVAFIDAKPAALVELLCACQQELSKRLSHKFHPYELQQMHATLVGLEHEPGSPGINRNFLLARGERRQMDILGYAQAILEWPSWPLAIRFAGFAPHHLPFYDNSRSPFIASFGIYGNLPVIAGWPIRLQTGSQAHNSGYTQDLDNLRRLAQSYNILHKYHVHPGIQDNSLYLRLGVCDPLSEQEIASVSLDLRTFLQAFGAVTFSLSSQDISLVSYIENTLPPETSHAVPLHQLAPEHLTVYPHQWQK
jgi:hypothetical protein